MRISCWLHDVVGKPAVLGASPGPVIATNRADYTVEGAKALLAMQVKAAIGVIVAMTSLTLLAVEEAINAVLAAVRLFVNDAVGFPIL